MTGDIGAANKGRTLELDLASLERMRRVRLATKADGKHMQPAAARPLGP